jgi:hypothetical protein
MNILRGKTAKPRRCLLYGPEKIGKSTWANNAPRPVFINLEDGLDNLDCAKTAWLQSAKEVVDTVSWLATAQHDFLTVVIDSIDWMQKLIFIEVAQKNGKATIEDIGYGRGYDDAAERMRFLFQGLEYLRSSREMMVIFLAHEAVTPYTPPGGEKYDRYAPALHKNIRSVVDEWCDEIFFANYRVFTKTEDLGFNKVRTVALGGQQRYIRTTSNAATVAGNRLDNIPEEISMDFSEYSRHWPGNVNGLVNNGSSKKVG